MTVDATSISANVTYGSDPTLTSTPLAIEIQMNGSRRIGYVIKNTGVTNAITTVSVEKDILGDGLYVHDLALEAAIGATIATGAYVLVTDDQVCYTTLKITLASTSGTTASVRLMGRQ